jgi:hypothetical protein
LGLPPPWHLPFSFILQRIAKIKPSFQKSCMDNIEWQPWTRRDVIYKALKVYIFSILFFKKIWNTTAFLDILRDLKRHNSTLLGSLGWENSKNMGPTWDSKFQPSKTRTKTKSDDSKLFTAKKWEIMNLQNVPMNLQNFITPGTKQRNLTSCEHQQVFSYKRSQVWLIYEGFLWKQCTKVVRFLWN